MADDYELLPSDEVEYLRREIEKIKAKPFGSDTDSLIGSIRQLQSSIDALVRIFAEANDLLSKGGEITPPSTITNDSGVLTRLEMQNEKIARSIVNLANNMKKQEADHQREYQDFLKKRDAKPRPPQVPTGITSGIAPSGLAPLSNAKNQAEHDKLSSSFPLGPDSHNAIPRSQNKAFPLPDENDEELPEPPKPLY